MPHKIPLADYYRAHGRAFRLALELGCTPNEAAAELRKRDAAAADRAAALRLETKIAGAPPPPPERVSPQQAFANSERLLGEH